ncbi:MAG: protein-tyrosine phosphatase [Arenicella sp.]|jgi:protein-tyrosine phosphatase
MGFISNLFKKNSKLDPIDLSVLNTDLHSHLIPGIDDGSKSMEESIAMLKKFSALGFKKVITTPHVMSDYYKNNPEIILGGLEKVRAAIEQEDGLEIEIEAAAEYYLDQHLEDLIEKKEVLTFGDNYVLFELSFSAEPPRVKEVIFALLSGGYKPILAHVERYPFYFDQWNVIDDIINRGCLLQMNINSLSGQYGPGVKKMAESLIDKDMIDVIGSDCHHMGHLELLESVRTNPYMHKIVNKSNLLNKKL